MSTQKLKRIDLDFPHSWDELTAHQKGEIRDPESHLLHMQHVCWNAIALLHFALEKEKRTSLLEEESLSLYP